ncbi:MAG: glycerol-3-phosphate 1-O-acyltransferase PlsY [Ruminococcaceae bacterium]|nr:glycerol-3-phosphate 1-O-acyltransferase PlsY [Oscillospiraceae bacterium]
MNFVLYAIIGYLIGCLNFGVIVPKIMYRKDIREYGSGNAGATNAFRVFGKIAGVIVLVLDFSKSLAYLLVLKHEFDETSMIMLAYAGLFVVIGHIFPVFFGFKGGKGVSATGGTIAAICPFAFVPLALVFILTILIKKKVGLGSVVAVSMIPFGVMLVNFLMHQSLTTIFAVFAINLVMSIIVVYRHKENIIQMKKDGII